MKSGKLKKRKAKNSTKMKRKAISHVEMMLSFVIFIMFILVFLIVFNPFKRNATNYSLADIVNLEIRKNTSIDVLTGSFSLTPCTAPSPAPSPTEELCYEKIKEKDCFSIKHLMKDFKKTPPIVKNETGSIPKFHTTGEDLWIKPIGRFYYIYYSKDFDKGLQSKLVGCTPLKEDEDYEFGITKNRSIMSMKRLKALNITYWKSYESYKSLKQYFRFPEANDFGFVIRNDTDDIIINSTRQRPRGLEVIVKQEPVEIIDETANFTYGKLDIFVW